MKPTNLSECHTANQELKKLIDGPVLTSDQYFPWLTKWQSLYKSFFLPPLIGIEGEFHTMYWHLDQLKNYLSFTEEANQALTEYKNLVVNDEPKLLSWLVKYEAMHTGLSLFIYDTMSAELDENLTVIDTRKVKVDAGEFMPLIRFCKVYHPLYFEKLDKYNIYTREEERVLDYNGGEGEEYFSLKFQLRRMIE